MHSPEAQNATWNARIEMGAGSITAAPHRGRGDLREGRPGSELETGG